MVTILDDGLEKSHPDLSANYVRMKIAANFYSNRWFGNAIIFVCLLESGLESLFYSKPLNKGKIRMTSPIKILSTVVPPK